jgi:alkylation response protein AidB-like acyl-CoA dehydrogenase
LGAVAWDATPESRVASGSSAGSLLRRTADRAAVATAAELLGLTERMIGLAADYAKERHQFGKPIGSFQAVKHLLAGAQVKLEFARPVVYGAAWSLDQAEPTASRAASTAKAYASDAATEAARVSLQVHGAIGYTWECDLHLFLKRAWALAEAWGSAAEHRSLVLDSLAGGA